MSEPGGIVDAQQQALLALIEARRDEQCAALRERAAAECRRLLAEARREARRRMHAAVDEERRRSRTRLTAARAALQTGARRRRYQAALGLLEAGWPRLRDALLERWREPVTQRLWVAALVSQALEVLPPRPWRIEHPAGWSARGYGDDVARITGHAGAEPEWAPRDDVAAGLRIWCGAACLDGSADGLLVDRDGVQARLLAELNRRLGGDLLAAGREPAP